MRLCWRLLLLTVFCSYGTLFAKIDSITTEYTEEENVLRFIVHDPNPGPIHYNAIVLFGQGAYAQFDSLGSSFTHKYARPVKSGDIAIVFLAVIYDEDEEGEKVRNRLIIVPLKPIETASEETSYAPEPGSPPVRIDLARDIAPGYWTLMYIEYINEGDQPWLATEAGLARDPQLLMVKEMIGDCVFAYHDHQQLFLEEMEVSDSLIIPLPIVEEGGWGRIFFLIKPQQRLQVGHEFSNSAWISTEGEVQNPITFNATLKAGYDPSKLYAYPPDFWRRDEPIYVSVKVQNDSPQLDATNVEIRIALGPNIDPESVRLLSCSHMSALDRIGVTQGLKRPMTASAEEGAGRSERDWTPYWHLFEQKGQQIFSLDFHNVNLSPYSKEGEEICIVFTAKPKKGIRRKAKIDIVGIIGFDIWEPYRTNTISLSRDRVGFFSVVHGVISGATMVFGGALGAVISEVFGG